MTASSKPMRTRMAPSPTGFMHVGNFRTYLYDYFLARQSGGQLILRIEDTDRERLVSGTLESLLQTLKTFGLNNDEGPYLKEDGTVGQKGEYGPYIQSERLDLYKKYAAELVEQGHAYYCFCSEERLIRMREDQIALKQAPKYDRLCLRLSAEELKARLAKSEPYVIRLKIPEGESVFVDAIRGEIRFQNAEVDDQVLIKGDGFPTYHLAVVVDDHLMKITHVLRGEEWIPSTPKQIILYQMFGWEMPVHAHVPLLLNPDKTKLSKRKGDVSVESYLAKGYLPEALFNFLALLGWNPTGDREIYMREELITLFDLSKVNKAGAVLNVEKLHWTNAQYLRSMPEDRYVALCQTWVHVEEWDEAFVRRACVLFRERVQVFNELPGFVGYLFQKKLEQDASLLPWKTQTKEEAFDRLCGVREWIGARSEAGFGSIEELDQDLRAFIQEKGWGNGDTLWPLRVALSGQKQSPSPFELLWAYGKERSLQRIDEAIVRLTSSGDS